ncbi:hypothetical protein [Pseudoteredinibacter isoporae]|uniref:Uncharacterized protein n=1 Tax=Pseudoteredinibacter isoporae TaxID=570281 RepID=A0A7X0JX67_9GAMM|nr:hypothetical protein [Pseudoteredinibacter isoporae]MBB6523439.1 hypothetical protein [Pseudoteredinibacter isoporae]NHO88949.1 hypothetical protein [Pseudoteredinibacter isoporae]NIB24343.1 hypothetical protein [Pseudoteredinibacter isoporae]
MRTETVKEIISAHASLFQTMECSEERWIILADLPLGNHHLGLDTEGRWVTEGDGKLEEIESDCGFETMIKFVESSFEELVLFILHSLESQGLPASIAQSFPFDEFLCYAALRGQYWAECVSKWVKSGYPINYEIALALGGGSRESKSFQDYKKKRFHQIVDFVGCDKNA